MPKLKLKLGGLKAIRKRLPGGLSILYFTKRNPGNPRKSKKGKGK